MKYKILGWIAIAWGGLILVTGIVNVATGRIHSASYGAVQAVALGFAVLMLYAGIRALWTEPGQSTPDRIVRFKSGDREMDAVIEAARQDFPDFMRAFQAPGEQQHGFHLKVAFVDDDEVEQVWVADLGRTDTGFSGVLASEPLLPSLQYKQPVEFERNRITDWMFIDHGRLVGGYTTRLIRQRMNSEEREAFDASVPYSF
jgi:uncharacterized protein YegJ (DUF2314 family)